jgi:cytochrome c
MRNDALVAAALAGLALAAAPAYASTDLATKSGCLACHTVDKKLVGPSFKEIAAKYRGDAKAEASLVKKVKDGGVGVWGEVPMPPNTHVKDEDVKALVKWIAALK